MEGLKGLKVLAFAASNSSISINQQLARYAASLVENGEVELLDIHDYEMPIYRHDREQADGIPQQTRDFLAKVCSADVLIVSFAEHNGAYSAAFKNLFDWCTRIDRNVWQGKRMVLLSTSPGERGGQSVLEFATAAMPRFGAEVVGSLSVPSFGEKFDSEAGVLADAELDAELRALVAKLEAA